MPILGRIAEFHPEMMMWRHDIHAHPEMAFKEHRTSDFVAAKLTELGIPIDRGLAGTGVVGTLRCGGGERAIALRADMDALPIHEKTGCAHTSTNEGIMHACGHDGHTTMLLGAARYLAETRNFDGTVHFVFQPAEENECGGQAMVEAGLFTRFPVEAVYGMHNWPGVSVGAFAVRSGPIMAADDKFEITITSRGAHAAMPHLGDDPILAAGAFVGSVQRIVSRAVDPQTPLVVSITQIHGGNVVPGEVWLQGTCRFFDPNLSELCRQLIGDIAAGIAAAHGVGAKLDYQRGYPPLINTAAAVTCAIDAAASVVGREQVTTEFNPSMGCEDFAYMIATAGGAYTWIGAGEAGPGEGLHGDRYDFNDELVPIALRYWVNLARQTLALSVAQG